MKKKLSPNFLHGYFGKLPLFNDFIKFNAGNDEILVLDKWLQEGLNLAKQNLKDEWKTVYEKLPPIKFFYPFTGTDKCISGIIFPSYDRSGREYPFLTFNNIDKEFFKPEQFYVVPLALNEEFILFEKIFDNININTAQTTLNENIQQISNMQLMEKTVEQYHTFLIGSLHEDFWQRTYRNSNAENKYYLIKNLLNPAIKHSTLILKFNFTSVNDNEVFDICFLLNLTALNRSNNFLPAVFWTRNENGNILLYIFPSKPTPVNFLDIIYSNNSNDRILKVDEITESVNIPNKIKNLLDNKEISLKDLLRVLSL